MCNDYNMRNPASEYYVLFLQLFVRRLCVINNHGLGNIILHCIILQSIRPPRNPTALILSVRDLEKYKFIAINLRTVPDLCSIHEVLQYLTHLCTHKDNIMIFRRVHFSLRKNLILSTLKRFVFLRNTKAVR